MSWLDRLITKDKSDEEYKAYYQSAEEEHDRYQYSPYEVRTARWEYRQHQNSKDDDASD